MTWVRNPNPYCLEYLQRLQSARQKKKKEKNNKILRKPLAIIDRFGGQNGLSLVAGHVFANTICIAPILGPEPKRWICHPVPLFMAVSMMLNICTLLLHTAVLLYYCCCTWLRQVVDGWMG